MRGVSLSLVVVLGLVVVACGSRKDTFDPSMDDGGDVLDGFTFETDGGTEAGNCTTCSPDLKSVVDCDSNQVIQTCTGDQGCGPGGCINACDAAAANKSSIGCDYYALPPDAWNPGYSSGGAPGNCFAAFVNNMWGVPLKVTLVWKGKSIDATPYSYTPKGSGNSITYQPIPSTGIPANSMAIVFLNQTQGGSGFKVNCPQGTKAAVETEDMVVHGTALGNAMEIKTNVPAIVYDIYPFGGAASYISSGTLLLPTTAWDTNYVAVTMATDKTYNFPPGIDLVARENGTTITLLPKTDITAGGGVMAATKNTQVKYTLNQGQTVHIMEKVDAMGNDLTGSVVQSNVPIGVWGEHFCMVQSNPPKWRIVGMVNATSLTYDPPVAAGPKTLQRGELVEFDGPEAFRIKGQDNQHPFYLGAHRPGGDCDAAHQQIPPVQALASEYVAVGNETTDFGVGGPETVNVVPPEQYLFQYLFFTDPTYGYTEIALVRGKAPDNTYKDVTLDCGGKITSWKPIGSSGYQYTHVDLQKMKAPVGGCDNGLHTIKSDWRFGITVWGYDSASSYAYPAGASVKPINMVVVPPTPN